MAVKAMLKMTAVRRDSRIQLHREVELPAVPSVGDMLRAGPYMGDEGLSTVTRVVWLMDGTLEVELAEVSEEVAPMMSTSSLMGFGWKAK